MRYCVLVEHVNSGAGQEVAKALHDGGFAVATCPGPTFQEPCPLLRGDDCPLAARADAIVSNLSAHPDGRAISACLLVRHPRTPLVRNVEPHNAVVEVCGALGR